MVRRKSKRKSKKSCGKLFGINKKVFRHVANYIKKGKTYVGLQNKRFRKFKSDVRIDKYERERIRDTSFRNKAYQRGLSFEEVEERLQKRKEKNQPRPPSQGEGRLIVTI